jgi:SAM-dependent methyltransferase
VTSPRELPRSAGRNLFGIHAEGYAAARPRYPEALFDLLRARCGLRAGVRTFEIGPGPGVATQRLAELGANPIAAIEPDAAFRPRLESIARATGVAIDVHVAAFEDVDLPGASFDLGLAATSFHWVDTQKGLAKVAALLRSGGWWVMGWNVFGDPARSDAFHDATVHIFDSLGSCASGDGAAGVFYALDAPARLGEIDAAGCFEALEASRWDWTLTLDTARVRALYATFSTLLRLDAREREEALDAIAEVAESRFGGSVERNMVTAAYIARRR